MEKAFAFEKQDNWGHFQHYFCPSSVKLYFFSYILSGMHYLYIVFKGLHSIALTIEGPTQKKQTQLTKSTHHIFMLSFLFCSDDSQTTTTKTVPSISVQLVLKKNIVHLIFNFIVPISLHLPLRTAFPLSAILKHNFGKMTNIRWTGINVHFLVLPSWLGLSGAFRCRL